MLALIAASLLLPACVPIQAPSGRRPPQQEFPAQRPPQAEPTPEPEDRTTAEWAYQKGLKYLSQNDYDNAIQFFQLAIERDPQHVRAYLSLAEVHSMREEFLVAESYYDKVLQLEPDSVPAINALATMQWRMGNHRDALSLYRNALERDPQNQFAQQQMHVVSEELFDLHYSQGLQYQHAGNLDQAVIEFQKAASLAPEDEALAVEIGAIFLQQNDYAMADGYFQQALSAKADFLPAILGAGRVQLALDHYDEAIRYFERARMLNPADPEPSNLLQQARREQLNASLPDEYWNISASPQVTRGEIAALLMVDVMLEHHLRAPENVIIISDITTHWAKSYIMKVVQYGIMNLPPDRFFRPDEPITRGELAFVLDTLFRTLGTPLPPGGQLPFSDVHPDNAYYDAIARVHAAGLMPPTSPTAFGILGTLSGAEALRIFEQIQALLQ